MRNVHSSTNVLLTATLALGLAALLTSPPAKPAHAAGASVEFKVTDDPARWFDTGVSIAGTRSLAVLTPGGEVKLSGTSDTVHTVTSLIFPSGAAGMPFDTKAMKVSASVDLITPGLYVFTCKIHPYMFGASSSTIRARVSSTSGVLSA